MPPPTSYDPNSPDEMPVALPSAPRIRFNETTVLQPPLTRRGTGPGMVIILPDPSKLYPWAASTRPLDPEPIQKWAEEGFAVVGVTPDGDPSDSRSIGDKLHRAVEALVNLKELTTPGKIAVLVYDAQFLDGVSSAISDSLEVSSRLTCLVVYGAAPSSPLYVPTMVHSVSTTSNLPDPPYTKVHKYGCASPYFVLPQGTEYDAGSAALAHSRTLVFLREHIGGPHFDIEAIWEEHTYFEFELRSVAKTMGTMVAEPYVNHVPTMTGGVGRENLTAFYRDHFIFANPADAKLELVSRTVGPDRVVDEFVYNLTHDRTVDWLLPGVPPTGRKLAIPMIAVVNVRGDRLYNEHIWWDQATALLQAEILPTHVPHGNGVLRLPVAGAESARMLVNESQGNSNEMFGEEWGLKEN